MASQGATGAAESALPPGGQSESERPDSERPEANPFAYDSRQSAYEISKEVFFMVTLIAPLRFLLVCVLVLLALACSLLATVGLDASTVYDKPYPLWRRRLLTPIAYLCRAALFVMGFYHIKVTGAPAPDAPFIVCNHVSVFDALVVFAYLQPSIVAKAELMHIPVLGRIFRGLQVIPVERDAKGGKGGREETKRIIQRFAESQQNPDPKDRFPPVLIFPQGTCTKGSFVTMFQRGAFLPGLPVQPVALKYPYKHFDLAHIVCRAKDHFHRRHFTQFVMHLEVTFLPMHRPTEAEVRDPTLFANVVRQEVADVLGATTTDHYYEDAKLYRAALQVKENRHVLQLLEEPASRDEVRLGGLQLMDLKDIFRRAGLGDAAGAGHGKDNLERAKLALAEFQRYDVDGDSFISYEEFCRANAYDPQAVHAKTLFDLFDSDGSGKVDFRELVVGMAMCSGASMEDKGNVAFALFDANHDGVVSESELRELLTLSNGGSFRSDEKLKDQVREFVAMCESDGAQKNADGEVVIPKDTFARVVASNPDIVSSAFERCRVKSFSFGDDDDDDMTTEKKKAE